MQIQSVLHNTILTVATFRKCSWLSNYFELSSQQKEVCIDRERKAPFEDTCFHSVMSATSPDWSICCWARTDGFSFHSACRSFHLLICSCLLARPHEISVQDQLCFLVSSNQRTKWLLMQIAFRGFPSRSSFQNREVTTSFHCWRSEKCLHLSLSFGDFDNNVITWCGRSAL